MKKSYLLLILLCLLGGSAGAATLTGKVESVALCGPMAGQKVYISDSMHTYRDSTVTNSSGLYSFTLPAALPLNNGLMISSAACGVNKQYGSWYTGSNITNINFIMCGNQKHLIGKVWLGTTANAGPAVVYLIRKQYDPVIGDTTLTAIDSQSFTGSHYAFWPLCIPSGTLLLKVALKSGNAAYSSYLPTYYTSAINWSGAAALPAANFNATSPTIYTDVHMTAGTNLGGPGFIGGSVLLGANKSTAVGDPLSQRILLLTNSAGQAVGYTYSNTIGGFEFPNLAYGTYNIFGDAWGKTNPQLSVTLSPANPAVSNVVFEENNKTFKGHIGSLSISPSAKLNAVTVYPNPVTDLVQFKGLDAISGSKTVVLSDVTGAVIARQIFEVGASTSMATANLAPGIYMLQVQSSEGTASFRIVK